MEQTKNEETTNIDEIPLTPVEPVTVEEIPLNTEETVQTTPEGVAPTPKPPKQQVTLANKAMVQFFADDGTVQMTREFWRNLPDIIKGLHDILESDPTISKDTQVKVTVPVADGSPNITDENGAVVEYTLAKGATLEAIQQLILKAITPQRAINEFQAMASQITDRSELKGLMVTFVFGDASVGGFGMLSTVAEVTPADIVTLVEASTNQAELMKSEMKKKYPLLAFPSDKGGLILPGQFRK